jgi:hypothetical protein
MLLDWGLSDPCAGAAVLMVRVEVPEPVNEGGENAHVGAAVRAGTTLQDKFTAPVNPSIAETVIVEVADPPSGIDVGEATEAATLKSGPWL